MDGINWSLEDAEKFLFNGKPVFAIKCEYKKKHFLIDSWNHEYFGDLAKLT